MGHKIQITVDDELNHIIRSRAAKMGLSVSSYARLALLNAVPRDKNKGLLAQAMADVKAGDVETMTLEEFQQELDDL